MPDDAARRIARLAKRAKELDDLIAKTAKMQKKIVDEIQRLGINDRVTRQAATPIPSRRKRQRIRR